VVIVFVVIAGFVFTVSTTSLGYSRVKVVTTSEKTLQNTSHPVHPVFPVLSPVSIPNLYSESMMLIRRSETLMVLVA
jgi:hypothetical protein